MKNKARKSWMLLLAGIFIFSSLSACGQSKKNNGQTTPVKESGTFQSNSVESRPKNAPDQVPAFPQQTRVSKVDTNSDFKVTILTEQLSKPWGMDFLPDGRMVVSELSGVIRIVTQDGDIGKPLIGVPKVLVFGVTGMMDVKVAPDFESSRYIYWTYPEPLGNSKSVNCVARARLSRDESSLEDIEIIYRASTSGSDGFHLGSRMLFDENGLLYVTLGDRFHESVRDESQELTSDLGKILRINPDGTFVKGNPFVSNPEAQKAIWSLGHRNPQGLAINPVTGDLWASEHGPHGGDELNIIRPGANYGWPITSFGKADGGGALSGLTKRDDIEQPVYYWDPSISPCGMTFYTGNLIAEWKNNLFIGALGGRHIVRMVIDNEANQILGEERLLADEGQRFRHIVQGPDQALYIITDQGRIYRIGI